MGEYYKMRKELYLPILGIAVSELMIYYGRVYAGLGIHIVNLQIITLLLIFGSLSPQAKNILQSLLLLLLLRIVSLAMPQIFSSPLLWYLLVYGVMFLPVYLIIKNQQISPKELGVNFSRLQVYLPSALLIGAITALIEYRILAPVSIIKNMGVLNVVLIAIVMLVFVGAVEELIFRSILQTRLEEMLGLKYGLLLSAVIFGIMHASYGTITEILLAGIFGIIVGYIFQRTRSLPFIVAIHGTANVLLFGILPVVLTLK